MKGLTGDAHDGAAELRGDGSSGQTGFHGNIPVFHGPNQGLGHVLIFRLGGVLNEIKEFGASAVADPVPGGGLVLEVLRHQEKFLFLAPKQLLGEDPDELGSQKSGSVFSFCGAENPVKPLDRFRSTARVEGGKDQVAGLRGLEGGGGREGVTDLAQQDDIRGLAEGPAKAFGEGRGVGTDFPLGEVGKAVREEVFDGILDGDDVKGKVLVQPFEAGGHGGGFSGTGGPGHEDEAGGPLEPFLQEFHGESEPLHRGDAGFDAAENGAAEAELSMEVDAEADSFVGDIASIVILSFGGGAAAGPEVFHPGRFERGRFHSADGFSEADVGDGIFA